MPDAGAPVSTSTDRKAAEAATRAVSRRVTSGRG
jgi:hypothetical protein